MKTAVITFGRFNPITIGHEKLVNKVRTVARLVKGDPMIFMSHTQDPKKDPLDYNYKVNLGQKAFGKIVVRSKAKLIFEILAGLTGKYDKVVIVAGSDRIPEFKRIADKYNGKDFSFEEITVTSAGERDPDSTDNKNKDKKKVEKISQMSASAMRALAAAEQLDDWTEDGKKYIGFKNGLPAPLRSDAENIMKRVRKGSNL